jgi:hypothetical protein
MIFLLNDSAVSMVTIDEQACHYIGLSSQMKNKQVVGYSCEPMIFKKPKGKK